jgi:hypothetical protein
VNGRASIAAAAVGTPAFHPSPCAADAPECAAVGAESPGAGPQGRKRAWITPAIRTGHLFESNSLACGKNTPMIDQCNANPAMS